MDRVTDSFLKKFAKEFGFENEKDKTVIFEYFVNYTLIGYKRIFNDY